MHEDVATRDVKTRKISGQEEYNFTFSAQCQNINTKRGGRNPKKTRKHDPPTLVADPSWWE